MKAAYANLISTRVTHILCDNKTTIPTDLRYLNAIIYPRIADAMWKGNVFAEFVSSRMTDNVKKKLRDDGYIIRTKLPAVNGSIYTTVEWGLQKIYDTDGEEKWVSIPEYLKYVHKMKETHNLDVEDPEELEQYAQYLEALAKDQEENGMQTQTGLGFD